MEASRGRVSPSVARSLSRPEAEQLIATARGLPPTWVVAIEPPYGQLAISPVNQRYRHHRCFVASVAAGRIYRD